MDWKPNPRQARFLALPDTIKEALYGGGAGSAKSETLLMYGIVRKFYENPRFKQVFMRRTFPELRNEVVPRAKQLYRPFGAKWNGSDMVFRFDSGATIFMGHCETEDDVHKYDSMEINLFTPDELTSFTEDIYTYIAFQRVRTSIGTGLPAIIRAGAMPGGIGHTFVRKRFIDPYFKLGITDLYDAADQPLIGKGGIKRIYIHATQADNPHIDPDYKNSLEALSEAEKKAKKYGDWDAYQGQVFDEFREKPYTDEPSNAVHVIDEFAIPSYWPKIVVGDWGYRANTWIGFGAISPDKRLYIYRELSWRNFLISEWAPILKPFIDREQPKLIKFCKSAGQNRGLEHTVQSDIETALGRSVDLTENLAGSRIAGKVLIHEYLRWKATPNIETERAPYNDDYAMWLLRNKGSELYKQYIENYSEGIPEVIPKLQIFRSCKLLIEAIKACKYAKPKDGKPAEDVAEFDGDDPYDGLRYLCDAASSYIVESQQEFEKVSAQEKIERAYNESGDFNKVFRMAKALEASQPKIDGIRRYHH